MEKRTNELLQKAIDIMGQDSDLLIIAHKEGQCGAVVHGGTGNIAQAIFSCIHQPDNPTGNSLYQMIKLNAVNILKNPSPYAIDLIDAINNIIPDER